MGFNSGLKGLKSCKSTGTERAESYRVCNGAVHITVWVDHDLRGRVGGNPDLIFGGTELKSWPEHCLS